MGAGVEDDLLLFGKLFGHIDRHAVQVAERRHGSDLALGEKARKILLVGKIDPLRTGHLAQPLEIQMA